MSAPATTYRSRSGIPLLAPTGPFSGVRVLSDEQEADIADRYQRAHCVSTLAHFHGVSRKTIYAVLRRQGVRR